MKKIRETRNRSGQLATVRRRSNSFSRTILIKASRLFPLVLDSNANFCSRGAGSVGRYQELKYGTTQGYVMQLFHGSDRSIEHPEIRGTNRYLDFGIGFYTTSNEAQALRWAARVRMRNSAENEVLSVYNFDMESARNILRIKEFHKADQEWLDFVLANRKGIIWPEPYDMVIGPVADNSVYATLKLLETGLLDIQETIRRLKTENLCDQIMFHTGKALEFCSFIEAKTQGGQHRAV